MNGKTRVIEYAKENAGRIVHFESVAKTLGINITTANSALSSASKEPELTAAKYGGHIERVKRGYYKFVEVVDKNTPVSNPFPKLIAITTDVDGNEIYIRLIEKGGDVAIDMRKVVTNDNDAKTRSFTKEGFSLPIIRIEDILRTFATVNAAVAQLKDNN